MSLKLINIYESLELDEYFDEKLSGDIKNPSKLFSGRMVDWYGIPGRMIVLDKSQVHGMWGNIYDSEKLEYVKDMVENSEDNVEFECSYAIGNVVEFVDIKEHQEANFTNNFNIDFDGFDEPYSIGDDELDEYIGNVDYIEDNYYNISSDDLIEFYTKYRFSMYERDLSEEDLLEIFKKTGIDDKDGEDYKDEGDFETFEEFIRFETDIKHHINNEYGDIGKFSVQLRDAHHRVFGSIKAGERYICVNIDNGSIKRYKKHLNFV